MPRYRITIEYDGTPFVGWQAQAEGLSVQGALEEAVFRFSGQRVRIKGAGRTDAGVHALGQVAHFDLGPDRAGRDWESGRIRDAINFHLRPAPAVVLDCTDATADFDARFSATARHYLYRILDRRAPPVLDRDRVWWLSHRLDAAAMSDAATAPGRPPRFHDVPRQRLPGQIAGAHARPAQRPPRGSGNRDRSLGARVPAQSGAIHGRLAETRRRGEMVARRSCFGAGRPQPHRLRPRRSGRRGYIWRGWIMGSARGGTAMSLLQQCPWTRRMMSSRH